MESLGNQFLARSPLTDHKDRAIERRGTAGPLDRVEKGETLPHELICPLHCPDNWCRTPPFGKIFHEKIRPNSAVFAAFQPFLESGMTLVWYEAYRPVTNSEF